MFHQDLAPVISMDSLIRHGKKGWPRKKPRYVFHQHLSKTPHIILHSVYLNIFFSCDAATSCESSFPSNCTWRCQRWCCSHRCCKISLSLPMGISVICLQVLFLKRVFWIWQINSEGVTRNFYPGDQLPLWHEEMEPHNSLLDILNNSTPEPMNIQWSSRLSSSETCCPKWELSSLSKIFSVFCEFRLCMLLQFIGF